MPEENALPGSIGHARATDLPGWPCPPRARDIAKTPGSWGWIGVGAGVFGGVVQDELGRLWLNGDYVPQFRHPGRSADANPGAVVFWTEAGVGVYIRRLDERSSEVALSDAAPARPALRRAPGFPRGVEVTEVDDLAFAIGAGLASGLDPNSIAQHLVEAGWRPAGKKSMPVFGAVAFIALVVGGVASLLLWDWRWVVIGVGLVLVVSAVGAAKDGRHG